MGRNDVSDGGSEKWPMVIILTLWNYWVQHSCSGYSTRRQNRKENNFLHAIQWKTILSKCPTRCKSFKDIVWSINVESKLNLRNCSITKYFRRLIWLFGILICLFKLSLILNVALFCIHNNFFSMGNMR